MNEGTGWAAGLKRAVYARMEELSFRSAVATAAGVLAITGAGVTLTVTSGGSHQLAVAPPAASAVGAQSTAAPSPPAVSLPAAAPSPSASPARVVPEAEDQPVTGAAPEPTQRVTACFPGQLSPWPDATSRRRGAVAVASLVPARLAPGIPAPAADGSLVYGIS